MQRSRDAVYLALRRLVRQRRLAMPRRGFYLILDPQFRTLGAAPPTSWIDDLMRFHRTDYYVALLTAAALHGAAHQKPQEFQVVARASLRPLTIGSVQIRFFFRGDLERAATERRQTPGGYIPVSTAEMTAFDLVRYRGAASIDHAATVISELAESMDAQRLAELATRQAELPVVQRLGYLLELAGNAELAAPLAGMVAACGARFVALEPGSREPETSRSARWRVIVNTAIELEA